MKTLAVTSPHIHGQPVIRLQKKLKKNWTGVDFLQGEADGDFGPETGRACIRAKFWLGYPSGHQSPAAGDLLLQLLTKKDALPREFQVRRAARLKAAKRKPLRLKALANAEELIGMKEHPAGSNKCPVSDRWGLHGPWCAMTVSECYIDAGSKAFKLHVNYAYVPFMLAAAEHGGHGLSIVRAHAALPGDIACFDWDDDGIADHTGFLASIVGGGGSFSTVEGNTAVGNDSNGGEVMRRSRSTSDVATYHRAPAFIRVGR